MTELFSSFDGKHEPWIYANPTELMFDGLKILIIPWINDGNRKETYDLIENTDAQIIMGHLEVAGFEMSKGSRSEHGTDAAVFSKFDKVMSGHFHHKSDDGTIYYLGAPYEITWTDYQDPRGFHVFDTDTRELEYIRNPYRMFHKIYYNDLDKTFEEVTNQDFSSYEGTCVKVVVQNKTNPYWFDIVIDKLYKTNPFNVTIVEDFTDSSFTEDQQLVDQAEDTMTILNKYIESLDVDGNKQDLKQLLYKLYTEAATMSLE
jgi:DNA repair exonuclease SbcCD nuclease subunit